MVALFTYRIKSKNGSVRSFNRERLPQLLLNPTLDRAISRPETDVFNSYHIARVGFIGHLEPFNIHFTMATTDALSPVPGDLDAQDFQYRTLSSSAIASLVLGLLSGLVFLAGHDSIQACLMMCPIPILGLVVGLRSLSRIRSRPESLSGSRLAAAGVLLSGFCLLIGLGYSGYVYATEVPTGYTRTSFTEFRPDEVELRGRVLVPPDIAALDGKKVFIKGFIRADSTSQRHNIRNFLLVRDNYQCCFGDLSKVKFYDQVLVTVDESLHIDFSNRVIRMGGTLHVLPDNIPKGPGHPAYTLEADYAG